jgi:hypothetical protein
MLIEKQLSTGDIVSIKLVNGDELIAKLEYETADTIKVHKPLAITVNGQGLGMIPWIFLGDRDMITLKQSHVLAMVPSKKDAAKQYLEGTSGIALI